MAWNFKAWFHRAHCIQHFACRCLPFELPQSLFHQWVRHSLPAFYIFSWQRCRIDPASVERNYCSTLPGKAPSLYLKSIPTFFERCLAAVAHGFQTELLNPSNDRVKQAFIEIWEYVRDLLCGNDFLMYKAYHPIRLLQPNALRRAFWIWTVADFCDLTCDWNLVQRCFI